MLKFEEKVWITAGEKITWKLAAPKVPIRHGPHCGKTTSFIIHSTPCTYESVSEFSGHFHMPALMLMRWHVRLWNHMSEENACGGKSHSSAISRISEWWQMRIIPHDKFSDKLGKIHEHNHKAYTSSSPPSTSTSTSGSILYVCSSDEWKAQENQKAYWTSLHGRVNGWMTGATRPAKQSKAKQRTR